MTRFTRKVCSACHSYVKRLYVQQDRGMSAIDYYLCPVHKVVPADKVEGRFPEFKKTIDARPASWPGEKGSIKGFR